MPKPSVGDAKPSVPSVDEALPTLQKPLNMLPHLLVVGDSGLRAPELSDLDRVRLREREARLPLLPGRGAAEVPSLSEVRNGTDTAFARALGA